MEGLLYGGGVYGTDQKRVVIQRRFFRVMMVQTGDGAWTGVFYMRVVHMVQI